MRSPGMLLWLLGALSAGTIKVDTAMMMVDRMGLARVLISLTKGVWQPWMDNLGMLESTHGSRCLHMTAATNDTMTPWHFLFTLLCDSPKSYSFTMPFPYHTYLINIHATMYFPWTSLNENWILHTIANMYKIYDVFGFGLVIIWIDWKGNWKLEGMNHLHHGIEALSFFVALHRCMFSGRLSCKDNNPEWRMPNNVVVVTDV